MKYIIEHNIDPPVRFYPGEEGKYPFKHMEVGDSFFIEETNRSRYGWMYDQMVVMAEALAFRKYKQPGWIFCSKHIWPDKDQKEGVRVWRVK